jgi:hypothetical protein
MNRQCRTPALSGIVNHCPQTNSAVPRAPMRRPRYPFKTALIIGDTMIPIAQPRLKSSADQAPGSHPSQQNSCAGYNCAQHGARPWH